MQERYLPIGTVVLLNNGNKKLMITGFCTATADDPGKIFDYAACLYPEGVISTDQILLFNHSDINQIFFLGYVDQEQQQFIVRLSELMNQVNTGEVTVQLQPEPTPVFEEPTITELPPFEKSAEPFDTLF